MEHIFEKLVQDESHCVICLVCISTYNFVLFWLLYWLLVDCCFDKLFYCLCFWLRGIALTQSRFLFTSLHRLHVVECYRKDQVESWLSNCNYFMTINYLCLIEIEKLNKDFCSMAKSTLLKSYAQADIESTKDVMIDLTRAISTIALEQNGESFLNRIPLLNRLFQRERIALVWFRLRKCSACFVEREIISITNIQRRVGGCMRLHHGEFLSRMSRISQTCWELWLLNYKTVKCCPCWTQMFVQQNSTIISILVTTNLRKSIYLELDSNIL